MTYDPRLDGPPALIRDAHYDDALDVFIDHTGRQVLLSRLSASDTWVDFDAPVVVPDPDDFRHADLAPEPPTRLGWCGVAAAVVLSGVISVGVIWGGVQLAILLVRRWVG